MVVHTRDQRVHVLGAVTLDTPAFMQILMAPLVTASERFCVAEGDLGG